MRDPYDVRVAFDDLYGEAYAPQALSRVREGYGRAVQALLRRAATRRFASPPPMRFSPQYSNSGATFTVLGDDGCPPARIRLTGLPILDELQVRYDRALPRPKVVRIDDETTYMGFRTERLGAPVKLNLPPRIAQATDCWVHGDEIITTSRMQLLSGGGPVFVTTGSPLQEAIADVLDFAAAEHLDEDEIYATVPPVALSLRGEENLRELCRGARAMAACAHPGAPRGVLYPDASPVIAATMSLVLRAERDPAAREEVACLGERTVRDAKARLDRAKQAKKWRLTYA